MTFIIHFLVGFLSSFFGSLTPSMLNMTALKTSLEKGEKESAWFSSGVSMVVLLQAYIAVLLAKYISENTQIIEWLEKAAIFIFLILSVYFYMQSKKEKQQEQQGTSKNKNSFLAGVFLSVLNMFAIPFYCGVATTLDMFGYLDFSNSTTFLFVIGSALGTFGILLVYVKYSKLIQQKTGRFTKDLNLVLSFLTGIVALFTFLKLFI